MKLSIAFSQIAAVLLLTGIDAYAAATTFTMTAAAGAAASQDTSWESSSSSFFEPLLFSMEELKWGTRREEFLRELQTTGIIAVGGQDSNSPKKALEAWCECYREHQHGDNFLSAEDRPSSTMGMTDLIPSTQTISLEDGGTIRTTLATATVGLEPLALVPQVAQVCGPHVAAGLDDMRDAVHDASQAFIEALDKEFLFSSQKTTTMGNGNGPLLSDVHGKTYPTVASIVKAATHLEHVHVYDKKQNSTSTSTTNTAATKALDFHTDAGLFLAFVPSHDCGHAPTATASNIDEITSSFWLRTSPKASPRPVKFSPETKAVIMLGAGAARWLQSDLPLKASEHAVELQAGQQRAWYGKMHLVPNNAIIQTVPSTKTFADLKQQVTTTSVELATGTQDMQTLQRLKAPQVGCGSVPVLPEVEFAIEATSTSRRRLQHKGSAAECNNVTNFFCWFQCLEIPDANNLDSYVDSGKSLYCLDPAVLAKSSGDIALAADPCEVGRVHNAACQGSWQTTADDVPLTIEFDRPPSVEFDPNKFCYGGTSMYMDGFHWVHDSVCVIYLFPGWVLSSKAKLAAASVGTIGIGILVEGIIWQRRALFQNMQAGPGRLGIGSILYGLQLTVGYFAMLVVMTYSGVLFLCTVIGLVLGNMLFNAKDGWIASRQSLSARKAVSKPCCAEEALEDGTTRKIIIESGNSTSSDGGVPEGVTPCCQHSA